MTEWRSGDRVPDWSSTDDGYIGRRTGPRREPPAICPVCGDEVLYPSQFGDPTCGESACREAYLTRPWGTAR